MSVDVENAEPMLGVKQKITAAAKYEEVSKLIVKFSPWYERLGAGGFLIVGGFSLVVSTISMSFYSGTDETGQLFGITFSEEVLYVVISLIFATLGAYLVNKKTTGMSEGVMSVLDRDLELEKFHLEMRLREMEITQRGANMGVKPIKDNGVDRTYKAIDNVKDAGKNL